MNQVQKRRQREKRQKLEKKKTESKKKEQETKKIRPIEREKTPDLNSKRKN